MAGEGETEGLTLRPPALQLAFDRQDRDCHPYQLLFEDMNKEHLEMKREGSEKEGESERERRITDRY